MDIITRLNTLTRREMQILDKLMQGLPNKIIASDLFISERTVKFHCANVFRKLGVRNRAGLVVAFNTYETFILSFTMPAAFIDDIDEAA